MKKKIFLIITSTCLLLRISQRSCDLCLQSLLQNLKVVRMTSQMMKRHYLRETCHDNMDAVQGLMVNMLLMPAKWKKT